MRLGVTELLLILGIVVLLFGHRLPQIGKSLGEGIRGFKKGVSEDEKEGRDDVRELDKGASHASVQERQTERQK